MWANSQQTPEVRRSRPQSATRQRPLRVFLDLPFAERDQRQRLDLYLPTHAGFPVVVFAHGGGWTKGDKAEYSQVGMMLASRGIGAALVNYRLSPQVRHPVPVQDLARAFAWADQHIEAYGGSRHLLFLGGHSAGAHLASLLATDRSFLAAEGLTTERIRGVVALSGVYVIHWNVALYGAGRAFRGLDRREVSPYWKAEAGCPPFLLLYAERDYWTLAGQARRFHEKLRAVGNRSKVMMVEGKNHSTIVRDLALPDSACADEIVRFVHELQRGMPARAR